MSFTIDRARLSSIIADGRAAAATTAEASERQRLARATLAAAKLDIQAAERRGERPPAQLLDAVAQAEKEFGATRESYEQALAMSRTRGGIARVCHDYAEAHGIRI